MSNFTTFKYFYAVSMEKYPHCMNQLQMLMSNFQLMKKALNFDCIFLPVNFTLDLCKE